MRFGLRGTGYWAENCHAAGLAAHPSVEFVGVWGRDPVKARAIADRYGVAAESDLDTLFAKVDAVAIAVPPDVQAELACRAAAAGCHLLLEKPLALSATTAEPVVAATQRAGVSSLVLFTLHFQGPTALWLAESVLGAKWHGGHVTSLVPPLAPDGPFGRSQWRQQYGALWDIGPHLLSITLTALGPVEKISAQRGEKGTIHLTLIHRGGALSTVTLDVGMPPETTHFDVCFWGPGGVVTHSPLRAIYPLPELMISAVSALLESIDGGTAHRCDARFAAEIVRILSVCERCLRNEWVRRGLIT